MIQNLDFFDLDEIINEQITSHSKNFEVKPVKVDFKLIFAKEFSPHIKSELVGNLTKFHSKTFLLLWIERYIERRFQFSLISDVRIQLLVPLDT